MLVDFWAILAFAIVLILFLILFILTKGNARVNKTIEQFESKDFDYMLNSYIKSPYLKDTSKTISEVISEDILNNDYSRTEESFQKFFAGLNKTNNQPMRYVKMSVAQGTSTVYRTEIYYDQPSNPKFVNLNTVDSIATIPGIDGNDIIVRLESRYFDYGENILNEIE